MKNILDELYDSGLFHLTKLADVGDEYRKKWSSFSRWKRSF